MSIERGATWRTGRGIETSSFALPSSPATDGGGADFEAFSPLTDRDAALRSADDPFAEGEIVG